MPTPSRSSSRALTTGVLLVALLGSTCARGERCAICYMPIPAETRTVVRIEGEDRAACDPRCVLTFREQTGSPAVFESVTDYVSGAELEPPDAFFVTGSDTAPDAHATAVRNADDTAYLHWHRCLPSVLAFSNREAAAAFQAEHGGQVVTTAELGF